jgi:hypothetical protein
MQLEQERPGHSLSFACEFRVYRGCLGLRGLGVEGLRRDGIPVASCFEIFYGLGSHLDRRRGEECSPLSLAGR